MNTIFIGIAGGTGSGKTTLTEHLAARFGSDISVVHHDNYYKRQDRPFAERCLQNYDHPDAFEWPLLAQQIDELRHGRSIEQPTYSYLTCTRLPETVHVEPRDVIIVEGIMTLYDRKLRDLMDLKIFVDAEPDERLLRVIERDMAERGHPLEMLIGKYRHVLKPMHDEFIEPTKQYADIIIPNGGENARAIAMMQMYILSALIKR